MATDSTGQIIRAGKGAEGIERWLNSQLDQIARAIPRGSDAPRLARIFATELQRVPGLLRCTPISLIGGFLMASQAGLELGSHLGQAWLVPFKVKGTPVATLIIGYKGFVALAYRSGLVQNVQAWDVREGDFFEEPCYGTDPKIIHRPAQGREARKVVAAYAIVRLVNAPIPNVEWMWRDEVDAVMKRSRAAAKESSPWHTDYPMMARKTALRRACKYIPQTAESRTLHTAINADEAADANIDQVIDVPDGVNISEIPEWDPTSGQMSPEEEARVFGAGDDS